MYPTLDFTFHGRWEMQFAFDIFLQIPLNIVWSHQAHPVLRTVISVCAFCPFGGACNIGNPWDAFEPKSLIQGGFEGSRTPKAGGP